MRDASAAAIIRQQMPRLVAVSPSASRSPQVRAASTFWHNGDPAPCSRQLGAWRGGTFMRTYVHILSICMHPAQIERVCVQ
jgi:hypothetical protein